MSTYTDEVQAFLAGYGRPHELIAGLRMTTLSVPLDSDEQFFTTVVDGLPWMVAFSSRRFLDQFVDATDRDPAQVRYIDLDAAELIDQVLDNAPQPTGLIVDPTSSRAMTFPPTRTFTPHCHIDDEGEVVRWSS